MSVLAPLKPHVARCCVECSAPLTVRGFCTSCRLTLLADGRGMVTPQQRRRVLWLLEQLARHDYPSWPGPDTAWHYDRNRHGWTSDCRYGCGAWMGGCCSGVGDSDDAFGRCPKAPVTDLEQVGDVVMVDQLVTDTTRPGMSSHVAPEMRRPVVGVMLRTFAVLPDGGYLLITGERRMGL